MHIVCADIRNPKIMRVFYHVRAFSYIIAACMHAVLVRVVPAFVACPTHGVSETNAKGHLHTIIRLLFFGVYFANIFNDSANLYGNVIFKLLKSDRVLCVLQSS